MCHLSGSMKSVVWCFVTALAAAASYNFADTEFNNFLDEELIEISMVSETPRSKRESDSENETTYTTTPTPPETEVSQVPSVCRRHCRKDRRRMTYHHSHRYHGCCGRGSFRNARFMKVSGDYMNERECMREVMANIPNATNGNTDSFNIYSCEEVNRMKKKHVCMAECLAKKIGVVSEDGSYDVTKAKELMVGKLEEEWQKELLNKEFDTCGDMKVDVSWKDDPEPYKCNPQALQMKHCIWRQLELNCPEDHRSHDKRCEIMRENLAKSQEQQT